MLDTPPVVLDDVDVCVDEIMNRLGKDLRVALPLGLGKPAELINALYARARKDPSVSLTLLTALSLEKPTASSELEAAFMGPILERVFAGVVALDYARDVSAGRLPDNVRVVEFFFSPGSRMKNAPAQRDYISTNYTFAARDVFAQGCNVLMQSVAQATDEHGTARYSLSCNPDTAPELAALLRAAQKNGSRRSVIIGVVNRQLPFMGNDAEITVPWFDLLVAHPRYDSALFSTPRTPVALADHAIGLHASALVKDGGTLQIGIGSLGDAIASALLLRHHHNAQYREVIDALHAGARSGETAQAPRELSVFEKGLYGATEMFVDGMWQLLKGGVLRRQVYDFWALQQLVNEQICDPQHLGDELLEGFVRLGVRVIRGQDFKMLQHHGVFRDDVHYDDGYIIAPDGQRVIANVANPDSRRVLNAQCLGTKLRNGISLSAGFFLGPRDFYQALRAADAETLQRICMTGVNKVNQLDMNPRLYRQQRIHARFINTGMMATLNGAVVSDGLSDGRVVSGVGGQYNFVAQAHQLETGRSILMVRAVRTADDGSASSNLVTDYGHCTIPRHLRDIIITEYGIADLRGQTDSEVAKRMLNIADSRFQNDLLSKMQDVGKIEAGYKIPQAHTNNTPASLGKRLGAAKISERLPRFPFGSEFTEQELRLLPVLQTLKKMIAQTPRWKLLVRGILGPAFTDSIQHQQDLERLGLGQAKNLQQRVTRALLSELLQARDQ